jgi:hypothetical protein
MIVKKQVAVMPTALLADGLPIGYCDMQQMARFAGRLSYMVDEKVGLTPEQLAKVVRALDEFVGLIK